MHSVRCEINLRNNQNSPTYIDLFDFRNPIFELIVLLSDKFFQARRKLPFHAFTRNLSVRYLIFGTRSRINQHVRVYRMVRALRRSFLHLILLTRTCFWKYKQENQIQGAMMINKNREENSPSQSSSIANFNFLASIFSTFSSLNLYQVPVSLSQIKATQNKQDSLNTI